jgi:hypothetical protein
MLHDVFLSDLLSSNLQRALASLTELPPSLQDLATKAQKEFTEGSTHALERRYGSEESLAVAVSSLKL